MKRITFLVMLTVFSNVAAHAQDNVLPISFLQGTDTLEAGKSLINDDSVVMVWSQSALPTTVEIFTGDGNAVTSHSVKTIREEQRSLTINVTRFCREAAKVTRTGKLVVIANKIKTPNTKVPSKSWTFLCPNPER